MLDWLLMKSSTFCIVLIASFFAPVLEMARATEETHTETLRLAEEDLLEKKLKRAKAFLISLSEVKRLDPKFKGVGYFEKLLINDPDRAVVISEIWVFRSMVFSRDEVDAQKERFAEREDLEGMSSDEVTARVFVFLQDILQTARTAYFHMHRDEIEEMINNSLP